MILITLLSTLSFYFLNITEFQRRGALYLIAAVLFTWQIWWYYCGMQKSLSEPKETQSMLIEQFSRIKEHYRLGARCIFDGPNFNASDWLLTLKYPELVGHSYCQLSLVFYTCLNKQLFSQGCASTIKLSKLVHHVRIVDTLTRLQLVKYQCKIDTLILLMNSSAKMNVGIISVHVSMLVLACCFNFFAREFSSNIAL